MPARAGERRGDAAGERGGEALASAESVVASRGDALAGVRLVEAESLEEVLLEEALPEGWRG